MSNYSSMWLSKIADLIKKRQLMGDIVTGSKDNGKSIFLSNLDRTTSLCLKGFIGESDLAGPIEMDYSLAAWVADSTAARNVAGSMSQSPLAKMWAR